MIIVKKNVYDTTCSTLPLSCFIPTHPSFFAHRVPDRSGTVCPARGSFDMVFEAGTADLKSDRRCFGVALHVVHIGSAVGDGDVLANRLAVSLAVVVGVRAG